MWGNMSPYSVSGAKPQPPNVCLDIIGAYVSAGGGKVAVMFFCHTPKKWGVRYPTPPLQKVGVRVTPVNYGYGGKGKVKHLASKYHSGHRGLFLAIRYDAMARASAWQRKV